MKKKVEVPQPTSPIIKTIRKVVSEALRRKKYAK
jgi:hypothetical protein